MQTNKQKKRTNKQTNRQTNKQTKTKQQTNKTYKLTNKHTNNTTITTNSFNHGSISFLFSSFSPTLSLLYHQHKSLSGSISAFPFHRIAAAFVIESSVQQSSLFRDLLSSPRRGPHCRVSCFTKDLSPSKPRQPSRIGNRTSQSFSLSGRYCSFQMDLFTVSLIGHHQ